MSNKINHLININKTFDSSKSLTEILGSFSIMSREYNDFNKQESNVSYSNYDYKKCTQEEQEKFKMSLNYIETLVNKSVYDKAGVIRDWNYIWDLLNDPIYAKTEKLNRKVVYFSSTSQRPIGEPAFMTWNGIQIIDLDIKNAKLTEELKPRLFESLCQYHWFLGICKSASGKGLHIWTKITPITIELQKRKIEYLCNFRHKYSYVYIVLAKFMNELGYTKDNILKFLDMAMAKPQQGIFISSDNEALMSTNFIDYRLDVHFEQALNTGTESIDWINHPDLKETFAKLEWFTNDEFDKKSNIEINDIENIDERNDKNIRKHYKHNQRWQLANTLTSIYGPDKALKILCEISSGTDKRELAGDIKTASIHNKPISVWAVKELNNYHGFNIKIKNVDIYNDEIEKLNKDIQTPNEDLMKVLTEKSKSVNLHLTSKQYLSDIKEDILANLGRITLLEAGAGYGKTEMIKQLGGKTLLILPFTSTIKSKIEADDSLADWKKFYGSKRSTLSDLLDDSCITMTIDKFSRLNVMEIDTAGFEYIVLDESHLLFISSYRDVMSPCIQRLANCKAKIIMMTGTPTGELLFFPNITHIKVVKEDTRIKKFDLYMCEDEMVKIMKMAQSMADDIIDGKKILFPTNNGNIFYDQIVGLITRALTLSGYKKELKHFYYKKSNFGDKSMDDINMNKTVNENDIVLCTTYLSVGVDICDRNAFSVYFDERWIAQDIEQFANRLRNNDLYVKMFLPKNDSNGIPINYYFTQPLDLSFNDDELLLARDLVKTCNDMLVRNNEESKYNPLITMILSENKFLKYDENDCKYYIDETTFKLKTFEDRYSDYSKQLEVLKKAIINFGYDFLVHNVNDSIPEDKIDDAREFLKQCKKARFNENTIETLDFLSHITNDNIDLYKEMMSGNYDLYRADEYKEIRGENNLYVNRIEIVEKNAPIVLSLYKYYDLDTIRQIFQSCLDSKTNKINYSKLNRIRKLANIENARRKKKLDIPLLKFIQDATKWANANFETSKENIDKFIKERAAAYANTIPGVVVKDIAFLNQIYEITKEIWSVVIHQEKPKNKTIKIYPEELSWTRKEDVSGLYGDINTRIFLLGDVFDKQKDDSQKYDEPEIDDLPITPKDNYDDVMKDIKNVVHESYDYDEYSKLDGSNERFMVKQENTNSFRDSIFNQLNNKEEETKVEDEDLFTMYNESEDETPF